MALISLLDYIELNGKGGLMQIRRSLHKAFREDHAMFGRSLHELRTALADGDFAAARTVASRIDREAGAHIAFEEADFYPALKAILPRSEVAGMYRDHSEGYRLLRDLMELDADEELSEDARRDLVERVENMQAHVSECGELFGALGRLSDEQNHRLLDSLQKWRDIAPSWSEAKGQANNVLS
jgi:hypothetical protein